MNLDANESERLWRMLAKLNAQIEETHGIASATALRLERFERNLLHESERAGHRGAKKGARWQAALVSAVIGLMAAVGNYYASRTAMATAHTVQPVRP